MINIRQDVHTDLADEDHGEASKKCIENPKTSGFQTEIKTNGAAISICTMPEFAKNNLRPTVLSQYQISLDVINHTIPKARKHTCKQNIKLSHFATATKIFSKRFPFLCLLDSIHGLLTQPIDFTIKQLTCYTTTSTTDGHEVREQYLCANRIKGRRGHKQKKPEGEHPGSHDRV